MAKIYHVYQFAKNNYLTSLKHAKNLEKLVTKKHIKKNLKELHRTGHFILRKVYGNQAESFSVFVKSFLQFYWTVRI